MKRGLDLVQIRWRRFWPVAPPTLGEGCRHGSSRVTAKP
jgi:hypothetical protein